MSYTDEELRKVRSREAIRLSLQDPGSVTGLYFGAVEDYWREVGRGCVVKPKGQLGLIRVGRVLYMLADFRTFVLAWPIWLGQEPEGWRNIRLDSDEKLRVFESYCHSIGNVSQNNL